MIKRILTIGFGIALLTAGSNSFGQGPNCAEMEPICTDVGVSFTAGVGEVSEPGNDYGCLFTQPNPSWYFLEIGVGGDIEMELFAGSDIDFIIWGPFDDLADAISNCGTLGSPDSPIVDCSYSGAAYETPEITGCVVGEVYILLITNYAAVVQDVTLGKIGGDAETNCDIIPPCETNTGTFTMEKNGSGVPIDEPLYLCEGDSFEILSNGDFELPLDTIAAPIGDGIYTAQIIWLVYSAPPSGTNPALDPNYLDLIIPSQDLADINDADSPIIDELGCGTYFLVPVTADDGVGDGGANDNGGVTWDKDGNGCYDLGTPIQITYACPIEADFVVNCGGDVTNGMDFELSGGSGDYTVFNYGAGDLVTGDVPNGGTATVENLENGWTYEIQVIDEEGCEATFTGVFAAPVINPIVITPAVSCPDASLGNVDVTIVDGSGNGAPYGLILNGTPTPGANADIDGIAGTAVVIIAVDSEGCVSDSVVTITSLGHYIDIDITTLTHVTCFGDNNGTASISANPVNESGDDDGSVVSIIWTDPSGTNYPGDETNTSRTGMAPGTWLVTVTDDYGCTVTIAVVVESPSELDVFVTTQNEPTCYGFSDASIDLGVTGGTSPYDFSWRDLPDETSDVLNTITAGSYWGYVTDVNGCMDSILVTIGQPDSLWATFIIKGVDCYGDSTGAILVEDVYNSSGIVRYYWDLAGVIPNPPNNISGATGLPAGTYLVTIQDEYCDNLYEFTITQNPEIVIDAGHRSSYCRVFSYQNGGGVVYASATGGVPDYDYDWVNLSTGSTSVNSTWGGLNPGDYELTVTDNLECEKKIIVTVDSLNPEAIFTVNSDQLNTDLQGTETVYANFVNESINFNDTLNPNSDTTFWWNFDTPNGDWILSKNLNEQFDTSYVGEAVYKVCLVAINHHGCKDTACKDITVYNAPEFIPVNVFTPDGDNKNDLFTFAGLAQGVNEFNCVVVDRWGNTVFEFTDIDQSWDGNRKSGAPSSDGVYFYTYKIRYTNGTKQEGQGNVTILRDK